MDDSNSLQIFLILVAAAARSPEATEHGSSKAADLNFNRGLEI